MVEGEETYQIYSQPIMKVVKKAMKKRKAMKKM